MPNRTCQPRRNLPHLPAISGVGPLQGCPGIRNVCRFVGCQESAKNRRAPAAVLSKAAAESGLSRGTERSALAHDKKLITIDGPAGCGKSTVAKRLAEVLGGVAFNTGHIYRAVTFLVMREGISLEDEDAIVSLLSGQRVTAVVDGNEMHVLLDGEDPGDELRTAWVTREIHWIADSAKIRDRVRPMQRDISFERVVVAEGRDLGTVVFPDAPVKVFLTASAEVRARRRQRELELKLGATVDFATVLEDVERRDRFDRERPVSPLVEAEDARVVDSTDMTAEEVVAAIREGLPEAWVDSSTG